jgi:hypothetical protein
MLQRFVFTTVLVGIVVVLVLIGAFIGSASVDRVVEIPVEICAVDEVPVIVEKVKLVPVPVYKEIVVRQWCAISYAAQEARCIDQNGDVVIVP